jgi:hypothetical protein
LCIAENCGFPKHESKNNEESSIHSYRVSCILAHEMKNVKTRNKKPVVCSVLYVLRLDAAVGSPPKFHAYLSDAIEEIDWAARNGYNRRYMRLEKHITTIRVEKIKI